MVRVLLPLFLISLLPACGGKMGQSPYPQWGSESGSEKNSADTGDSTKTPDKGDDSKSGDKLEKIEVANPLLVCGEEGNSCYLNANAMAARVAMTPSGKILELQKNARDVDLWMEKDGRRILRADGLDHWQMRLSLDGKFYSGTHFEDKDHIAGRVCPPNVYLDDTNKFATNRCLYYDAGETTQMDLNVAGASQSISGSIGLSEWSKYNNGEARWYVGNVQECVKYGMRLPALYETTYSGSTDAPMNFPAEDGAPQFAQSAGVVNPSKKFIWTATAARDNSGYYATWRGAEVAHQHYTFEKSVLCVLP